MELMWLGALVGMGAGGVIGLVGGVSFGATRLLRPRGLARFVPTHEAAMEGPPNSATRFLAAANDVSMTVVEAWNITQSRRDSPAIEALLKEGSLVEGVERMKAHGAALREELRPLFEFSAALGAVNDHLVEAWEYTIHDPSRFSLGPRRRTVLGDVRTYVLGHFNNDISKKYNHTFTFDADAAERALRALQAVGPIVDLEERAPMLASRRISTERLDDAERQFVARIGVDGDGPDHETLLNAWLRGSPLDDHIGRAHRALGEAFDLAQAELPTALNNASFEEYRNGRPVDAGPPEFQAATRVAWAIVGAKNDLDRVDRWLESSLRKARTLVRATQETTVRQPDRHFLNWANDLYKTTFPASPIKLVRRGGWLPAVLATIAGPAIGAALGAALSLGAMAMALGAG